MRFRIGMAAAARAAHLLIAGALFCHGCAREDVQLVPRGAAALPVDTPSVAAEATTRERYCDGSGPPFQAPSGGDCEGPQLAPPLFEHALCTCGDATFTAALSADGFDSRDGAYAAGGSDGFGASVGIGGQLITTAAVEVRGDLRVAGAGLMTIPVGPFHVAGDAAIDADLAVAAAAVDFGADLWLNGEILNAGAVSVAGDLRQTRSSGLAAGVTVAGQTRTEAFAIAPPCRCGEGERLDLAALVADGAASSHNRELGLPADALYALGPGAALELDCGRFAFGGGRIAESTAVTARGRSALFIDGDSGAGRRSRHRPRRGR